MNEELNSNISSALESEINKNLQRIEEKQSSESAEALSLLMTTTIIINNWVSLQSIAKTITNKLSSWIKTLKNALENISRAENAKSFSTTVSGGALGITSLGGSAGISVTVTWLEKRMVKIRLIGI